MPTGKCDWKEIRGFDGPGEYRRFTDFVERQLRDGHAVEVALDPAYGPGMLFGGRWFRDVARGEVWRLLPPDPPFYGLWEPVRR